MGGSRRSVFGSRLSLAEALGHNSIYFPCREPPQRSKSQPLCWPRPASRRSPKKRAKAPAPRPLSISRGWGPVKLVICGLLIHCIDLTHRPQSTEAPRRSPAPATGPKFERSGVRGRGWLL
jgi:hypothetical protein